jgi:hypothetical protein
MSWLTGWHTGKEEDVNIQDGERTRTHRECGAPACFDDNPRNNSSCWKYQGHSLARCVSVCTTQHFAIIIHSQCHHPYCRIFFLGVSLLCNGLLSVTAITTMDPTLSELTTRGVVEFISGVLTAVVGLGIIATNN